jgi:hypothetical protein
MRIDGVTAITMVLIASFAIDRIVTAVLFLLSFVGAAPDPASAADAAARASAERKYKLLYFTLAGALGVLVLGFYGQMRILSALGLPTNPVLDTVLTGIVLMGGADRIAAFLKVPGAAEAEQPAAQPIQITGTLKLEEGTPKKAFGQSA